MKKEQLRWITRATACIMECAQKSKKGEGCVPGASSITGGKLKILFYLVRHLGSRRGIASSYRKMSEEAEVSYAPVAQTLDALIRCGLVKADIQSERTVAGRGKVYFPVLDKKKPLRVSFFMDMEGTLSPAMEAWVGSAIVRIDELYRKGDIRFSVGNTKALVLFRFAVLCEAASHNEEGTCILPIHLGDLSREIGITIASASETITALEKCGLVNRIKHGGRGGESVFEIVKPV